MGKEKNRIKEIIEDIHADPEAMKQAKELAKVNSPQSSVSEGSIAEGRETGLTSGHATEGTHSPQSCHNKEQGGGDVFVPEDTSFNLSKEIIGIRLPESKQVLYVRKVKEFIKRIEKEVIAGNPKARQMLIKLREIAGDDLI